MQKSIRNIGIFAHVDAGKTSITENMLFLSGKTKFLGNVDDGNTHSDFLAIEKQRGISVRSSLTSFEWQDTKINLVDTPGHVDFSADVERVLQVIDAAILVISAVEGVQSHTESIWTALTKREVPTLFFINKIDRIGADVERVIQEITKELTPNNLLLQTVLNEGLDNADIEVLFEENKINESIIEKIANHSDEVLELFLAEEKIEFVLLEKSLIKETQLANIHPVFLGSAKNQIGVKNLLDACINYLPKPLSDNEDSETDQPAGLIYSIHHDPKYGKIAFTRLYAGKIENRAVIENISQNIEEKITGIYSSFSNSFENIGQAFQGDIVGITGLTDSQIGDLVGGENKNIPDYVKIHQSLLTVEVKANEDKDYPKLAAALQELSVEDPAMEFEWDREERHLFIKIMGLIQIEVIEQILLQRFGINTKFEDPAVIYKETPSAKGIGFEAYTMPKPCWAVVQFLIEPGERGSGVQYEAKVRTSDIHQKYQNEVERTIGLALKQGIKGWEVTDLKITLNGGEDHNVHSRPGNFILATPMGIMNGLQGIGTDFLEPLISFKINAAESLLGKITSSIIQMRGTFDSPEIQNDKIIISGVLPVATSLDFPVKLASMSGGMAKINTTFHGYQKCDAALCKERPFIGISPLDRSKYILKARKALS